MSFDDRIKLLEKIPTSIRPWCNEYAPDPSDNALRALWQQEYASTRKGWLSMMHCVDVSPLLFEKNVLRVAMTRLYEGDGPRMVGFYEAHAAFLKEKGMSHEHVIAARALTNLRGLLPPQWMSMQLRHFRMLNDDPDSLMSVRYLDAGDSLIVGEDDITVIGAQDGEAQKLAAYTTSVRGADRFFSSSGHAKEGEAYNATYLMARDASCDMARTNSLMELMADLALVTAEDW